LLFANANQLDHAIHRWQVLLLTGWEHMPFDPSACRMDQGRLIRLTYKITAARKRLQEFSLGTR
jgi:hypothetical protein